jgi:hypothetical protein
MPQSSGSVRLTISRPSVPRPSPPRPYARRILSPTGSYRKSPTSALLLSSDAALDRIDGLADAHVSQGPRPEGFYQKRSFTNAGNHKVRNFEPPLVKLAGKNAPRQQGAESVCAAVKPGRPGPCREACRQRAWRLLSAARTDFHLVVRKQRVRPHRHA